jgi:hypothetical protein
VLPTVFLASDDACYITGETLRVAGGAAMYAAYPAHGGCARVDLNTGRGLSPKSDTGPLSRIRRDALQSSPS